MREEGEKSREKESRVSYFSSFLAVVRSFPRTARGGEKNPRNRSCGTLKPGVDMALSARALLHISSLKTDRTKSLVK